MHPVLRRAATLVAATPLLVAAVSGTSQAQTVTVPGCYGGGTNATIVCNLTITVGVPADVETYDTTVPVCLGTCQQVPVTLVRTAPGDPLLVCYSYTNGAGTPLGSCPVTQGAVDDLVADVSDLVDNAVQNVLQRVQDLLDDPTGPVCDRVTVC